MMSRLIPYAAAFCLAGFIQPIFSQTTLISTGAVWHYLDTGVNPGSTWPSPTFPDASWSSGPAELGYGDNDEATLLDFGPFDDDKHITYYFRHAFNVANPSAFSNLQVRLLRDDGAVVYLNGVEAFRSNMPEGDFNEFSLASNAVADLEEQQFFLTNLDPSLLVAGQNVMAVEIHQIDPASSDISLDLALIGDPIPEISILSPTNNQVLPALNLPISVSALPAGESIASVEFFIDGNLIGAATEEPFVFVWQNTPPGTYDITARITDNLGLSATSDPVSVTLAEVPASILVSRGATWKYEDSNLDLGTAWRQEDYDDTGWSQGPGPLGGGDAHIITGINIGPDGNRYPTLYFRHKFQASNPDDYVGLVVSLLRDDGAAVYLNGQEIVRDGIAVDAPHTAFASQTVADAAETTYFEFVVPSSALIPGENTLAAQVKNTGVGSSDLGFDLELAGDLIPLVNITSPVSGQSFTRPAAINITAEASDDGGSIASVQFFDGDDIIAQIAQPPYSFVWSNALDGPHQLTAVAVDNTGNIGTSSPVSINVIDNNPPALVSATATTNSVTVTFSKRITAVSGENTANYAISGPQGAISILDASLGTSENIVTLSTASMSQSETYTLTVNGIQDLGDRFIASDSQAVFTIQEFILVDIGNPPLAGTTTPAANGIDVTSSGTNIVGNADQFTFNHVSRADDFDVKVRVSSLSLSDPFAKAGLMARDTLAAQSRFAAALATPGTAGSFFLSRSALGGLTTSQGFFPVNYPYTWLRLKREGDVFTGYAGLDGNQWQRLGQVTLPGASRPMEVGLALASGQLGSIVSAGFRDFRSAVGDTEAPIMLDREPLGPSSRRTGLVISEIMYHPADLPGVSDSLEYVEIYNGLDYFEDLSGWELDGDIHYTFPQGTILPSSGFLVVARDPAAVSSFYGLSGVLGPWRMQTNITANATNVTTENLPNNNGTLRLENELGAHLLEVNYDNRRAWPVAADGGGHSLVLARPSYGERQPQAWDASAFVGGSPGTFDPAVSTPLRALVINEFLAHTDPPDVDYIELFNTGSTTLNIGGCYISDDLNTNKFRIPNGTMVAARSAIHFTEAQLGFRLGAEGEEIVLVNPDRTVVLDALSFDGQENGVSHGRYPDGTRGFQDLSTKTPGAPNTPPLERDIVINEIMYRPIWGGNDEEYVEIYNRGNASVDMSLWSFNDGISFTFPAGTSIDPDGYLVVAKNRTNLLARYPNLASQPSLVLGDFDGALDNGGERIALAMPDINLETNNVGIILTNFFYITVDEVTYKDGGRWGQWADGGGSSLELIDPYADNRLAPNWADSDESAKSSWTLVEHTGPLQLGMGAGNGVPNRFEFFLQGPGECLVDNMQCILNGTGNRLLNGGFESGISGWASQGTHATTTLATSGAYEGNNALHVRATERGDTGANRIRTSITQLPTGGDNVATLGTRVRWLQGDTNILLRLRGQWLEAPGYMDVPTNLGTPGAPNSRAVANAAPAITGVSHFPALPASSTPVVVTAKVHDPDNIATVFIRYRLDPSATLASTAMNDNGTGPDAVAGDGIWSGQLPGQGSGTLVAFHVRATDSQGAVSLFPAEAPFKECLVRFGESLRTGNLANYRLWVTQSNLTYWAAREKNSNEELDATFVYGNWRVVYNARTLYSGSPFHTPEYNGPLGSVVCDYEIGFPKDDVFLGVTDFVLNGQSSVQTFFQNDVSAQAESTAYWMGRKIGLGFNHKRHVFMFLNGQQRGMIYFDHQQPNSEVLEAYFPNDNEGRLHKIEDWFEFDDTGSTFNYITALLDDYVVEGDKRIERYRWTFRPRAGTQPDDFEDLVALVDAINAPGPEPFTTATGDLINMQNWMRVLALQHMAGNWDSYGYRRGKNMYTYKPTEGPWHLLLWDLDLVLGKGSDGPTQNLFDTSGEGDPAIARLFQTPRFVRYYWRAFRELVDGPMLPANYNPIVNARYESFLKNGLPADSPQAMKNYIDQRRAYILSQFPSGSFAVNGSSSFSTPTNYITLTGTAQIEVEQILVNGVPFPITWTDVTAWSLRVPLQPGINSLLVQAVDVNGTVLGSRTILANYTGTGVDPADWVIFNELLFLPPRPGSGFLELRNLHPALAFNLEGWRLSGLDYTFPAGSVLPPDSFLSLVENRGEFSKVFGGTAIIHDQVNGRFDRDGETITLFRPGAQPEEEIEVDKIRYEGRAPWPNNQQGGRPAALQLIDGTKDNARVSNWGYGSDWQFYSFTGTPNALRYLMYPDSAGTLYLDDMRLVAGTVPGVGQNFFVNGDFETPLGSEWGVFGTNGSATAISAEQAFEGNSSLKMVFSDPGTPFQYIFQNLSGFTANEVHTLSFWYLPSSNIDNLVFRMSSFFRDTVPVRGSANPSAPLASPTLPNNANGTVPAYPLVWLNEVLPVNNGGLTDSQGEVEPWLELYNSGASTIPLDGFHLANNYLNLAQWTFPAGASIAPGEFKVVFLDGEPNETTANEWHTSFRPISFTGSLALSRTVDGSPQIVDFINFDSLPANSSYGSLPDGQLFDRQEFFFPTPGAPNDGTAAPLMVFINEWMADNEGFILDPADSDDDDWFEIYNPGPMAADLGGFYLTDDLGDPFQFLIPNNGQYVIPPNGHLLVWADGETGQNQPDRADLHVNFSLRAAGEAIGIFGSDGVAVDTVTFGDQTANVSEGRYPDGTDAIFSMINPTPRRANFVDTGEPTAPVLTGFEIMNGQFTFSFQTESGRTYRVDYKNNLNDPVWTQLIPPFAGTGAVFPINDIVSGVAQRFYRVVVVE